jgi:hypothetical protein
VDPGGVSVVAPASVPASRASRRTDSRASLRPTSQLRIAPPARGEKRDLFARQLGHDARLTLTRYGHVIDELEDAPQIEAEVTIADARRRVGPDGPDSVRESGS